MLQSIRRALPVVVRDVVGVGGAIGIVYGSWLLFAPLGFIVGGGFALLGAVLLDVRNQE